MRRKKLKLIIVAVIMISSLFLVGQIANAEDSRQHGGRSGSFSADSYELDKEEFIEKCKKTVSLGWVVCPVIRTLAGAVDALNTKIEEFFE